MLTNVLTLTDDELSAIQCSLLTTIQGYEKYVEANDLELIGEETIESISAIKKMYDRLEKEYF